MEDPSAWRVLFRRIALGVRRVRVRRVLFGGLGRLPGMVGHFTRRGARCSRHGSRSRFGNARTGLRLIGLAGLGLRWRLHRRVHGSWGVEGVLSFGHGSSRWVPPHRGASVHRPGTKGRAITLYQATSLAERTCARIVPDAWGGCAGPALNGMGMECHGVDGRPAASRCRLPQLLLRGCAPRC